MRVLVSVLFIFHVLHLIYNVQKISVTVQMILTVRKVWINLQHTFKEIVSANTNKLLMLIIKAIS